MLNEDKTHRSLRLKIDTKSDCYINLSLFQVFSSFICAYMHLTYTYAQIPNAVLATHSRVGRSFDFLLKRLFNIWCRWSVRLLLCTSTSCSARTPASARPFWPHASRAVLNVMLHILSSSHLEPSSTSATSTTTTTAAAATSTAPSVTTTTASSFRLFPGLVLGLRRIIDEKRI